MPTASTSWLQVAALRLQRQHLDRRAAPERLVDVAGDMVGMHAQVASFAELQFAARVDEIRRSDVRDAIADRRLVKTWAMRGTLHLLTADDLWQFVAAWPTRDSTRTPAFLKYFDVTPAQLDAIDDAIADVLDAEPRTRAELAEAVAARIGGDDIGERLSSGWGQFLKPAAGKGILAFGPDRGRNVSFVSPEAWLGGRPTAQDEPLVALGRLLERWLARFPGATREAAARWWGIASRPTMTRALAAAAADISEVDIEGTKGWVRTQDVAALSRAEPPIGVRLLPGFDPYVNDLPRRVEALLPVKHHELVYRTAGWITPVVLVGGRVAGTWELDAKNGIAIQPFARWPKAVDRGIAQEADRFAAFLDRALRIEVATPLASA
ncbi:MAG TPA: winged helix DNA-binding domain-containing protein [Candidatus Limnocylindrales bacterium]|nr:winged helix DNA-binding domain-containing protein [Candidatus Limnocylindrales bacterium]